MMNVINETIYQFIAWCSKNKLFARRRLMLGDAVDMLAAFKDDKPYAFPTRRKSATVTEKDSGSKANINVADPGNKI